MLSTEFGTNFPQVHFVTEDVDQGEIVIQRECKVDDNETVDTLKAKVQALEGRCLIEVARRAQRKDLTPRSKEALTPVTYKDAGVDIEAGDNLVEMIKPFCKATARPGSEGIIGGFGGIFDLKVAQISLKFLISP